MKYEGCETAARSQYVHQYPVSALHVASLGLRKEAPSKQLQLAVTFREQAKVLDIPIPSAPMENVVTAGENALVCLYENLERELTGCVTRDYVRRWQLTLLMYNHGVSHQHHQQQGTIVFVCTTRFMNGKVLLMSFCHKSGDGKKMMAAVQTVLPQTPADEQMQLQDRL